MSIFKELLQTKRTLFIPLVVVTAVMFALPAFTGAYVLHMAISILILALFSFSVNLLLGYTGLLSFGQGVFYASGAYACGKILLAYPNLPLGIIGGVAVAGAVALALGWFCIRHTAIYFTMITLAFGMMMYSFVMRLRFLNSFERGYYGLLGIPKAPIVIPGGFSISVGSMSSYYYLVLIIVGIAIFFIYRLVRSPLGLRFQAIRDSESRVGFSGISVRNTRLLSFVISGMVAGLAGALMAPLQGTANAMACHWTTSADPVIATLLGGMYTFTGPIVGAAIYLLVKDIVLRYTMQWMLPLGLVVVAFVLALRGGIVGSIEGWLARRRGEPLVSRR